MQTTESSPVRGAAIAIATLWTLAAAGLVLFVTGGGSLAFAGIAQDKASLLNALVPALLVGILGVVVCLALEFLASARSEQASAR